MSRPMPSRDALSRYAEVARQYRLAFEAVQAALAQVELGRVPPWVFAVERLAPAELEEISPALADAETRRRAWRTALHAVTELIALEDQGESGLPEAQNEADVRVLFDSLDGDAKSQRQLDRFISVINGARAGGCIYVNGTFRPIAQREGTPGPATRRADAEPSTLVRGLPERS